jgi:hypothetical protein
MQHLKSGKAATAKCANRIRYMSNQDDDEIDATNGTEATMPDPFTLAIELCRVAAKPATYAAAVKKLRKLGRDILAGEQKLAALTARTEQTEAEFAARAAELDERSRVLDTREVALASQAADVRDELRQHHARLEQTHRQLIHRIMSTTGILGEWNWNLQSPPTWEQLRQRIADLPPDLPVAPPAEVVSENVQEDWAGSVFTPGSSLTRTMRGAAS